VLQTLNLPVRTVPVVLVIGSVGLALYLSYALVSLAVLAKYSFGENISGPLIIFAILQFTVLTPLYFVMDKKMTKMKNS
jgi:Na+/glutamate symporter